MDTERGFLYITTGEKFLNEAMESAQSFKQRMPRVPIAIMTDLVDDAQRCAHFDQVIEVLDPQFKVMDKLVNLANSPFEQTIYIDSDTFCIDQCKDIFTLLDRFDMAVTHAPVREMGFRPDNCPRSFPELNTGVIAYNKCPAIALLFSQWYQSYMHYRDTREVNRDQLSFREVVYDSDIRFSILPPEYNLRTIFPNGIGGNATIKIVHDRYASGKKARRELLQYNKNATWRPLVYDVSEGAEIKHEN